MGYPPPSTETAQGSFQFDCDFTHQLQVDPIVALNQVSGHMHDFFGNPSVRANSTYESMTAATGVTCDVAEDTAGYWAPSLRAPDGSFVQPDHILIYYRNRPYEYGTTHTFPADFRMVAGGSNAGFSNPVTYWTCKGESDGGLSTRKTFIPNCGSAVLIAHTYFPSCWDGVRIDSPDHRSHMAYAYDPDTGAVTNIDNDYLCPSTHPVKMPQLDLRVIYNVTDGTGYTLSDGTQVIHADFWNTWNQAALDRTVEVCLRGSLNCGHISSSMK